MRSERAVVHNHKFFSPRSASTSSEEEDLAHHAIQTKLASPHTVEEQIKRQAELFASLRSQKSGIEQEITAIRRKLLKDRTLRIGLERRVRRRRSRLLSATDELDELDEDEDHLLSSELKTVDLDRLLFADEYENVVELSSAENSRSPRALQAVGERIDKNLECSAGQNCAAQQAACTAFFTRPGQPSQASVQALVTSHGFAPSPWDSGGSAACDRFSDRCYISRADAIQLLTDMNKPELVGHDCDANHMNWCNTNNQCAGCAAGDTATCDHCCKCSSTGTPFTIQQILNAGLAHEGNNFICDRVRRHFDWMRENGHVPGVNAQGRMRRHWNGLEPEHWEHVGLHIYWEATVGLGARGPAYLLGGYGRFFLCIGGGSAGRRCW